MRIILAAAIAAITLSGCSAADYDRCMDGCDAAQEKMPPGSDRTIAHSDCVIACVDTYKKERWYSDPTGDPADDE
jgi:hypothetical protein